MLKTEAIDFQMSGNEDLPDTDDVDEFWAALHEVVSPGSSEPTFATMLILVRNADSERCFSMVRKIDSEDRSHLERSTVASLLTLKINVDENCYSFNPSEDLLAANKSAIRHYNEMRGSYSKDKTPEE